MLAGLIACVDLLYRLALAYCLYLAVLALWLRVIEPRVRK